MNFKCVFCDKILEVYNHPISKYAKYSAECINHSDYILYYKIFMSGIDLEIYNHINETEIMTLVLFTRTSNRNTNNIYLGYNNYLPYITVNSNLEDYISKVNKMKVFL